MTETEITRLRAEYPEVLSGEQVRRILHVSKRRCAWMLHNGIIACQDNGKKSRRYAIRTEDLIAYLRDLAAHPEKDTAVDLSQLRDHQTGKAGFPERLPRGFRTWLKRELASLPDALTVPEVIAATGYCDNTVDRWLRNGWLRSTQIQMGRIIAKDWLIDFYCAYGYRIAKMSDKHLAMMHRYFSGTKRKHES